MAVIEVIMVMMLSTKQRRCRHAMWQRHFIVGVARCHRHFGNIFVNNFSNLKDALTHKFPTFLYSHGIRYKHCPQFLLFYNISFLHNFAGEFTWKDSILTNTI